MRAACLALIAAALWSPRSARAADPVPYQVTMAPSGNAALDKVLADSSSLRSLRTSAPVGAFALIGRARLDEGRFRTVLDSEGFYDGGTTLTIEGRALDDAGLPDLLEALPAGRKAAVAVTTRPGVRFTLGQVRIEGDVPAGMRDAVGVHAGDAARAAPVLAAGTALLAALEDGGYALAVVPAPVAVLHPAQHTLSITWTVVSGPRVDIGPITLTNLKRVKPDYVRRRMLLRQGEQYNPDRIEAARQDLAGLPVFASVRVKAASGVDAAGQLPIDFDFTERLRHVVSLNAAYSTDLGGSVGASWSDRNLFGRAEQLTLSVTATQLGGSASTAPGYNATATLLKPDWLRRNQNLQFDVIALREYLESYDRTAETIDALLSRSVTKYLSLSVGVSATGEVVRQEGESRNYLFAGVPLGVKFDTTGSLLAPIHGWRAAATITPTESFGGVNGAATYVLVAATGSTYLNLGRPGRSVLALRASLGVTEGASQFGLPPDQRQYAGGSGTIRGYAYQQVGPLFADNKPAGGTSLDAGSVEFRQRFGKSYGAAVFVDAGQVGTSGIPFEGSLRAGVGLGARYYTGIGPIRVDVATPVIHQQGSGPVQVYIGLGEAF